MNEVLNRVLSIDGRLGTLALDVEVQLINCSASGSLLHSTSRLAIGTVGVLHLIVGGVDLSDPVRVVRACAIEGASAFHIGVQFIGAPGDAATSLRKAIERGLVKPSSAR